MRGLEQFSHLWLLWHFHQTSELGWSPLVQPPRLGGKKSLAYSLAAPRSARIRSDFLSSEISGLRQPSLSLP